MNWKFYLYAILGFLLIPAVLCALLLSPYFPQQYSFLHSVYVWLKPYGRQVFVDKQSLWGYAGVLSAAVGVLMGLIYKERLEQQKFKKAIYALYYEFLRNVDNLFTGEVERSFSSDAFEKINRDYADKIKGATKFYLQRKIYDELYYYREILRTYWIPVRTFRSDLERRGAGILVAQKQFGVCNLVLEYFEGAGIDPSLSQAQLSSVCGNNRWERLRTMAIDRKNQHFDTWKRQLKNDLEQIFKVMLRS